MRPRKNDPPLTIIDLSQVTVGYLQDLLSETDYFGFPCVLDSTTQLLAGFLTRRDIQFVLGEQPVVSLEPLTLRWCGVCGVRR